MHKTLDLKAELPLQLAPAGAPPPAPAPRRHRPRGVQAGQGPAGR